MHKKQELIERAIAELGEHFTQKELIWRAAISNAKYAVEAFKPRKTPSALPTRSSAWKKLSSEQQERFRTEDNLRRRLQDASATSVHRANLIGIFVKVLLPLPLATELVDTLIFHTEEDAEDP